MKMNKLLQLLRDNGAPRAEGEQSIRVETVDNASHVYIYDVIDGFWGASATGLLTAFAAAGKGDLHLHINSPGGDVFEARAMAAIVVAHPGNVAVHIDGLAASAATYLALSGNSVSMTQGGMLMVHESWSLAYGNKRELTKTASLLSQIDDTIIADYVARTGKSADEVRGWIEAETWFQADQALELGFIDAIDTNTKRSAASAQASAARWNLNAYANAPKPAPKPAPPPPPEITPQPGPDLAALTAQQLQNNRNRMRLFTPI